ncbi:MAG: hypothetical protein AB2809_10485 [Candidatus Thiodiazotropha sp.]
MGKDSRSVRESRGGGAISGDGELWGGRRIGESGITDSGFFEARNGLRVLSITVRGKPAKEKREVNVFTAALKIGGVIIPMFLKAAADGKITGLEIAEMITAVAKDIGVSFEIDWMAGWDEKSGSYKGVV